MTNETIFNKLNLTRHITRDNPQLDIFTEHNAIYGTAPDNEYWLLSDLYNILGEQIIPERLVFGSEICSKIVIPYSINKKIFKEMDVDQRYDFTKHHTERLEHEIQLNNHQYPSHTDHKATRYACWSFVKDNPNATFARLYFMSCAINPNMQFKQMSSIASEYARIKSRQDLSAADKQLSGIIRQLNGTHNLFYHTITPALFDGFTADQIKEHYNIPPLANDPLLNYLNDITLRERTLAITRAINKFYTYKNQNINTLHDIVCEELRDARRRILRTTGHAPENQICKHSIATVEKHRKENELLFVKKYANQKIK